jgi:hypothetical protein
MMATANPDGKAHDPVVVVPLIRYCRAKRLSYQAARYRAIEGKIDAFQSETGRWMVRMPESELHAVA